MIHTLTTWLGIALILRALASLLLAIRVQKFQLRSLVWGSGILILGQVIPHSILNQEKNLFIPLIWISAPFSYWCAALSILALFGCIASHVFRVDRSQSKLLRNLAPFWFLLSLATLVWAKQCGEKFEVLQGQIPITPTLLFLLLAIFVFSMMALSWLSRLLNAKEIATKSTVIFALFLGSVIFCLPLSWMVLTSFKEHDDNTADSLIWAPRVTKSILYRDPSNRLFEAKYRNETVLAKLLAVSGEVAQLEIERPFLSKGWQIERPLKDIKEVDRTAPVVAGKGFEGYVKQLLPGGLEQVVVLKPLNRKGEIIECLVSDAHPVKEFGLKVQNYSEALEWLPEDAQRGLAYIRNTLLIVVLSVIGSILSCSLVAFAFSRIKFPGKSFLFGLMMGSAMLPSIVTMLPRFLIWKNLHMIDTLVPLWLPSFLGNAFNVFLLREFFRTIPKELEDAAKIDGCSPWRTYWQIMLPLIKPALTVIGIWAFMGSWNDFMSPLIYLSSPENMPVAYGVQLFASDRGGDFGYVMALATMSAIPVLAVFLAGQKFFVQGVQLSGLGGK